MSAFPSSALMRRDLSLQRSLLLEASAGTGKTYSIQSLYLRLILEEGYRVNEIVVVTFTKAATSELRERLRAILHKCRLFLDDKLGEDPDRERISIIIDLPLKNREGGREETERLGRVCRALADFDSASIFTIHGFCHRVLKGYAFESGHRLDAELVGDSTEGVKEAVGDWWRRNCLPASALKQALLADAKLSPDRLERLVRLRLNKPDSLLLPLPEVIALPEGEFAALAKSWDGEQVSRVLAEVDLNRSKFRDLPGLLERAQDILGSRTGLEHLSQLRKFSRPYLENALKRGSSPLPENRFFQACSEFFPAWDAAVRAAAPRAVEEIAADYHRTAAAAGELTYTDLLVHLRNALVDPDQGEKLLATLRDNYRAALIDEFQDTDPVQYEIFRRIFAGTGMPLAFVGDPKQAIYGFRNGDIHTYYEAAEKLELKARFTLDRNYRSEKALVEATNLLFADSGEKPSFLNPAIRFAGDLSAEGKGEEESLLIRGRRDPQPFRLWIYPGDEASNLSRERLAGRIYADVADEIARLLTAKKITLGSRSLRPSDIAVLVLRHQEAQDIHRELRERGIPAARQSAGPVFASGEAYELGVILDALLQPGRARRVRAALSTPFFALSSSDLLALASDPPGETGSGRSLAEYLELFREAARLWREEGFIRAFRFLDAAGGGLEHLLAERNGERRATNYLHLVELLHQADRAAGGSAEACVLWFRKQRAQGQKAAEEEYEIRLESDEEAVRLMTVFRSKGLQFPVVFVPTIWSRTAEGRAPYEYHRKREGGGFQPVIDLGDPLLKSKENPGRNEAEKESREENLRLLYVACTRAINRVYLACPETGGKNSPLGDLLGGGRRESFPADGPLKVCFPPFGSFETEVARPVPPPIPPEELVAAAERLGTPLVPSGSGQASFSSLVSRQTDFPVADRDEVESSPEEDPVFADILSFPAGARVGECWHEIFEEVDFPSSPEEIEIVVGQKLRLFRLLPEDDPDLAARRRRAVSEMVCRALDAELEPGGPVLSRVSRCDRISELEFSYALRETGAKEVASVLQRHWAGRPDRRVFLERIRDWDRPIPAGIMTGFIDLIFRQGGRYYLVDWKSNRRTGRTGDFVGAGLRAEMAEHLYFLQCLFYAVAVHNLLKERLAGYDYRRHFGGAYYVFLRGVDGRPGQGIFAAHPEPALIEELSLVLLGRGEADNV